MKFDRTIYFDSVRDSLFAGSMDQRQVDGQNAILDIWEALPDHYPTVALELSWLAYMLATTYHETSQQMWPIEEYGHGQGQPYGKPDPQTGETYYGRGYVQLTWRENYAKADAELSLAGSRSCELHARNALEPDIAAAVMFIGMYEGWFRPPNCLPMYFNANQEDAFGAREIINGDKNKVPEWSNGVSIGELVAGYYESFSVALGASIQTADPGPLLKQVVVDITADEGITVFVNINGRSINAA